MLNLFEDRGIEDTVQFIEEKVGVGLWSWNLATGDMHWSNGQFALFGQERGATAMNYERFLALVHPEDRRDLAELEAVLREGLPFAREYRAIHATGRMRWLAMRGEALLDVVGRAHRAIGVTVDITERREVQQTAVRDARFRTMMSGVASLIWTAKPDGTIVEVMGAYAFGGSGPDFGGQGWLDAVHPDDRDVTREKWSAAVKAAGFFEIEHRLGSRDGDHRLFHTSGVPQYSGELFLGWQGVCIDLSARKPKGAFESDHHTITGAQVRAARGILKWSVGDLAVAANVSPAIIRRIEDFDGASARSDTAAESLRRALIEGGAEFIYPIDGRPAVRPGPSSNQPQRPVVRTPTLQRPLAVASTDAEARLIRSGGRSS